MSTRLYYNPSKVYPQTLTGLDSTHAPRPVMSNAYGLTATPYVWSSTDPVGGGSASIYNFNSYLTGNPRDMMFMVFLSNPLVAGEISGTVKGQMRALEISAANNDQAQVKIGLIGSNNAYKSTLYGGYTGAAASEFGTVATNRKFPTGGPVTLTNQTASAGDRIVVSIGVRRFSTGSSAVQLIPFGVGPGDLPEDETGTADLHSWIEFSQDLQFSGTSPDLSDTIDAFRVRAYVSKPLVSDFNTRISGGSGVGELTPTVGQTWPRVNVR